MTNALKIGVTCRSERTRQPSSSSQSVGQSVGGPLSQSVKLKLMRSHLSGRFLGSERPMAAARLMAAARPMVVWLAGSPLGSTCI